MTKRFKIGSRVRVSRENDNEIYAPFRGLDLLVTHVSTRYMPAKDFFASGRPEGYHPGFDDCGAALYDLKRATGEAIECSLYDWELESC
jgi:hypothetical protein